MKLCLKYECYGRLINATQRCIFHRRSDMCPEYISCGLERGYYTVIIIFLCSRCSVEISVFWPPVASRKRGDVLCLCLQLKLYSPHRSLSLSLRLRLATPFFPFHFSFSRFRCSLVVFLSMSVFSANTNSNSCCVFWGWSLVTLYLCAFLPFPISYFVSCCIFICLIPGVLAG